MRPIPILLAGILTLGLASTAQAISFTSTDQQVLDLAVAAVGTIYTEVGDAGDHSNPQSITGSNITQINGTIGDTPGDPIDAFKFFFAGGDIQFVGTAFVPSGDQTLLLPLLLNAFQPVDPIQPTDPMTPDITDLGLIGFLGLPAGNYIIEAAFNVDPPFSIGIIDPITREPQFIFAPVPEPASFLLLTLGLLGLWRARHRR